MYMAFVSFPESVLWLSEGSFTLLTTLMSVFMFVLALKFFFRTNQSPKPSLPPSPPQLPLIGNLHQLSSLPHVSLHRLAQKLGPIIYLKLGSIPTVVVSSPALAKEVLKTHDLALASRPKLYTTGYLFYNLTDIAFSPYGPHWREAKKISTLELLGAKQVQRFGPVRSEMVARLVNRIKASAVTAESVNLTQLLFQYTIDVITKTALGRDFSGGGGGGEYDPHRFLGMIDEFLELFSGFSVVDVFPSLAFVGRLTGFERRLRRSRRRFDKFLEEVIDEHRRTDVHESNDIVDILLQIHNDASREITLTLDSIKAILLDLFVAGVESSSNILNWAMTELIKKPELLNKAQDEVGRVVIEKRQISESDLPNLHYMKAIIKETYRLHPPAPLLLPRESMESVIIGGYEIPTKARVLVNVWSIGRDPNIWENPNRFEPERFLGSDRAAIVDYRGQDFKLLPFGSGRRICPGISFATATIELALAQLLHSFDWKLPAGLQTKDVDMSEKYATALRRRDELILVAESKDFS